MSKPRYRIQALSRRIGDVVVLPCETSLDIPAERVLEAAIEHGLSSVVVMGYTVDGIEYFASSIADGGTTLWLIERLKRQLLAVAEEIPPREARPGGTVIPFRKDDTP